MIEIKELTKEYDGKAVVAGLNLTIKNGSIFGFLGPNGAGKTTTVKMIVGLAKSTTGTIKFDHKNIDKSTIGYMPEDPYFYDRLTAIEFLEFMASLFPSYQFKKTVSGVGSQGIGGRLRNESPCPLQKEKIIELLDTVGLKDSSNQKIGNFSKGMKQRLGLAQAIINDPRYLFLDEPLDGLDPIGRLEFKKIILDLKKQGKTIFFSSHILSDVEEICDEIGILNRGKLIYAGQIKEFCGKDNLEKKFVEIITAQS